MSRQDAIARSNEQVVTFSLVELLTQMVFVAMALAIVLQAETQEALNPNAERLRQLELQVSQQKAIVKAEGQEISRLKQEILDQQSFIDRLLKTPATTPLRPPGVWVLHSDYQVFQDWKADHPGKGTAAKPAKGPASGILINAQCAIVSGPLLTIQLLGSGNFEAHPAGTTAMAGGAAKIDGLTALTAAGPVDRARFIQLAKPVQGWAHRQIDPCDFVVRVVTMHNDAHMAFAQYQTVGGFFRARLVP